MVRIFGVFCWFVSITCISLQVHAESQYSILEMIDIPKGNVDLYTCPDDTKICSEPEFIMRTIAVPPFRIGKFEVTMEQWDACVSDGGCQKPKSSWAYKNRPIKEPCVEGEVCQYPDDMGWGRGTRPVINVSYSDVQGYIDWANSKFGKKYRLPTRAEWEYVARAGMSKSYDWGKQPKASNANCSNCGTAWSNKQTAPVGSFPPNRFGAFDMLGNVGEWVDQCLPKRVKGSQECAVYLFVGGGWFLPGQDLVPNAYWSRHIDIREPYVGFRLVEDI
ncbi:formylglycine-generating enzyme family protein [Vibrio campbellii]|uniref:formylglycine-generating enzyme family protein n=1 Tax=Vibrio campbellii TaxID=680 RepID=UPI001D177ADC|nr:SUMF1/EgtB/PvdO family nonheme iron enzyme [Vibrio campbellii]MCC4224412.1 formylglycine-generating enzyme family protein [Vibrio campbellii]